MDKRKTTAVAKNTTLLIGVAVILLSFSHPDWYAVGVYAGCTIKGRLLYSFYHANVLHAALNVWCLLSLAFIYDITPGRLLFAYLVAAFIPINTFGTFIGSLSAPTVGLSAIVYFLLGSISFEVARKWYYQAWMVFYLVIGFFFPNTNAWLHLYCYLAGLVYALLNKPIIIKEGHNGKR